jgi:hypothetical protein
MMMNRDRLSFWVRLVSIVLAAFFLISFIFLGLGTNISYNIFELIGNQDQQQQQADQAPDPQEQIAEAEKALEKDPKDPEKINRSDLQPAGAGREGGEAEGAAEEGGGCLRGLSRGGAGQRGRLPSGRPGLRPGRPARRRHRVLQWLPRPRAEGRERQAGKGQDLGAPRRRRQQR